VSEALIVYNPKSRRGQRKIGAVREWLAQNLPELRPGEHTLQDFTQRTDAPAMGADARVVVVGGDGTVNGTLETLRRLEVRPTVAIVPAGTGNNLADGLGISVPREPQEEDSKTAAACDVAFRSSARRGIDIFPYGKPGDPKRRIVCQSGSLGFPARVTARYDSWRKFPPYRWLSAPLGTANYRILAFLGIIGQKWRDLLRDELRVTGRFPSADGSRDISLEENILAIFVHNEPTVGGNFSPCPDAKVDDGLVDLCLVRARTGVGYLKLFDAVGPGEHVTREDMKKAVEYEQTKGPVIFEFSKVAPFVSDGDIWLCEKAYEIEVEAQAFEFAVPESAD